LAPPPSLVTVRGRIAFERVPLSAAAGGGLDYYSARWEPARGITVQALRVEDAVVVGVATTDNDGAYALSVPAETRLVIRSVAMLTRAAPQPLPHYQFFVDDGASTYSFDSPSFDSQEVGATQDVRIPAGFDPATRQAVGPRSAAPFAILDTVYTGISTVLAVAPATVFPTLELEWSPANRRGSTGYESGARGLPPRIRIAGEANVDTDEYDQHVLAHELGHYLEDQFFRLDTLGGDHRQDDRLDPRLAFSEGFVNAFAGMVLNDPLYRDTGGAGQGEDLGGFDLEAAPVINPGWYSEASNQQIVWDLFDAGEEPNDRVALGLAPLWQVLTGSQRYTDALSTLFPFIAALEQVNPGNALQIREIVAGQNVATTQLDAFGSAENNAADSQNVLPIYTPIVIGGQSRTVESIAGFDPRNKGNRLSVHRFLRLDVPGEQPARITVVSGIADRNVDIRVLRQGRLVALGNSEGNEDFSLSLAAGTYVLDVYDVGNVQGTGGASTPITVSVVSN
jgi:hypothetical protein